MRTKVKVGNITNLSDARYCAGMGVDWLGFQTHTIDPGTFKDITGWVSGPEFVVELGNDDTLEKFKTYGASWVELGIPHLSVLNQFEGISVLFRTTLLDYNKFKSEIISHQSTIHYLILNESTGDASKDQQLFAEAQLHFKVLIGFGVNDQSIDSTWKNAEGFNLNGTEEIKPGLKDYSDLSAVLEKLEVE
jgi:Phosphoribosylanthranilate isomerase